MAMTLVSTVTVGSGGAATVSWSSIPQTGKDLLVVLSSRNSAGSGYLSLALNSSTSNFTCRRLYGDGSSGAGSDSYSIGILGDPNASSFTANTFASTSLYITNYAGSTNKSYSSDNVQETNSSGVYSYLIAGLWSNTAAVNELSISISGGSFVQNTVASLYIVS